jgi:flavin-dependent dehydrogenase
VSRAFDLAVIGGGPAGASAAITAARLGGNVVLLEAGKFPRHKVCGEFVSGEALALLERLLGSSEALATAPEISCARAFIDKRTIEFPVLPPAMGLSRFELDLALWRSAVNAGVEAHQQSRVLSWRPVENGFAICLEWETILARSIVDASGRWSNLRTEHYPSKQHWIGIKGHFLEKQAIGGCDLYFFNGGYCGVLPLGDGRVNAAAMVRADFARRLLEVLQRNEILAERSECWSPESDPVSTAPLVFRAPRTSERGAALCGDAAAFLDPFAGDGISMALHSGRLAAQELARYIRSECSLASALQAYDYKHRELLQPALKNGAHLRRLLHLPTSLRLAAIALFQFPRFARAAVNETRVRRAV